LPDAFTPKCRFDRLGDAQALSRHTVLVRRLNAIVVSQPQFFRTRLALMNIGPGRNLGAPLQARVPPLLEPCFNLVQIPDNALRRKVEATRKVAALRIGCAARPNTLDWYCDGRRISDGA